MIGSSGGIRVDVSIVKRRERKGSNDFVANEDVVVMTMVTGVDEYDKRRRHEEQVKVWEVTSTNEVRPFQQQQDSGWILQQRQQRMPQLFALTLSNQRCNRTVGSMFGIKF